MVRAPLWFWPVVFLLAFGIPGHSVGGPAGTDSIEAGWAAFRMQEYRAALGHFEQALAASRPGSEEAWLALYSIGVVSQLQRPNPDRERARAAFERVVAGHPESDLAAWSLLRLARMEHIVGAGQTPDYERVSGAYSRVIEVFPKHLAAQEAFLHQQAIKLVPMDAAGSGGAEKALLGFLDEHPGSPYAAAAYSLLADCYQNLGRHREWLDAEIQALAASSAMPSGSQASHAPAYWKIATLAQYRAGDLETAATYYSKLVDEYPRDQRAYPSELALAEIRRLRAAGPGALPTPRLPSSP